MEVAKEEALKNQEKKIEDGQNLIKEKKQNPNKENENESNVKANANKNTSNYHRKLELFLIAVIILLLSIFFNFAMQHNAEIKKLEEKYSRKMQQFNIEKEECFGILEQDQSKSPLFNKYYDSGTFEALEINEDSINRSSGYYIGQVILLLNSNKIRIESNFTDEGLIEMIKRAKFDNDLKELMIHGEMIEGKGASSIVELIRSNLNMTVLDLGGSKLDRMTVGILSELFKLGRHFNKVHLHSTYLEEDSVKLIAQKLERESTKIDHLYIYGNIPKYKCKEIFRNMNNIRQQSNKGKIEVHC